MEEPAFADVDAAEELPVAVQVRVHDAIGRARRKFFQRLVQVAGAEHQQHHELVEVGATALDADLIAHQRAWAVAADRITGFQSFSTAPAVVLLDRDANAVLVLLDRCRGPAEIRCNTRQLVHLGAQHLLGLVLRQSLVGLRVEGADHLAAGRRMPIVAAQASEERHLADRKAFRSGAGGADFVDHAPELEVLHRALGEVLALGNLRQALARLDQRAGDAADAEVDGERHAHRSSAHDNDLITLRHASLPPT